MAMAKKKQKSILVKMLEAVVIIGTVAGILMKFFKGNSGKKK